MAMITGIGRVLYIAVGVLTIMQVIGNALDDWERYCLTKDKFNQSMALVSAAQAVWAAAAIAQIFK